MANPNVNVAPICAYPFSNPYALYDDLDLDYGIGSQGLGGSIFDGYLNPGMGMGMGMGMGFYPGFGFNNEQYFDYMKNWQKFQIDYNVDQQNMTRNADLRVNASVEGIKGAATILRDKIIQNEQDQIQKAYQAYINSVANAYGTGTPAEIKSRALTLYQQLTGKSLIQDLRENGHSSFTQGVLQSLTFSAFDKNSVEDNISLITGQPVGTTEKAMQNTGRVVGALGIGGLTAGAMKLLGKSGKIGALVGLGAAALSFITGKVKS